MSVKKLIVSVLCTVFLAVLITGCSSTHTPIDEKSEVEDKIKNILRVGMECGSPPYNWTQIDDSDGAVKINDSSEYAMGYDVIMAKKIAEKIDYDLEIYKLDWNGLVNAVAAGKVDVAIAGISPTSERMQVVDFSDSYYEPQIVAVTKKGTVFETAKSVLELDGAVCTSQLNTTWYNIIDQIPNANKQAAVGNVASMIVALSSNKVQVVVTDKPTAMAAQISNPDFVVLDFEGTNGFVTDDEDINLGIAVAKENVDLKNKINEALSEITKEERAEIMQKLIEGQPLAK